MSTGLCKFITVSNRNCIVIQVKVVLVHYKLKIEVSNEKKEIVQQRLIKGDSYNCNILILDSFDNDFKGGGCLFHMYKRDTQRNLCLVSTCGVWNFPMHLGYKTILM